MDNESSKGLQKVLKEGWYIKQSKIDFEKLYKIIENPQSFQISFLNLLSHVVKSFKNYRDVPFPLWLGVPIIDEDVREAFSSLSGEFQEDGYKDDYIKSVSHLISYEQSFLGSEGSDRHSKLRKLKFSFIKSIVDYLKEPTDIILNLEEDSTYLSYPTKKYKDVVEMLEKQRSTLNAKSYIDIFIYWGNNLLELSFNANGKMSECNLYISDQLLIEKALKGKVIVNTKNNFKYGNINNCYPLSSFNETILPTEIQKNRAQKRKTCALLQGAPGTGKTEWVKSFAKEVLEPEGFFFYFLDSSTIKQFSPEEFLSKVCIIVNEVDNLVKDRGEYDDDSGSREAILGLFDGSIYNSVNLNEKLDTDQEIIILLTCNTTDRLDSAFLRKGRVDVTRQFNHVYV